MDVFSQFVQSENELILDKLHKNKRVILSGLANLTAKCFLYSSFYYKLKKNIFVVVEDKAALKQMKNYMEIWGDTPVFSLDVLPDDEDFERQLIHFIYEMNTKKGIFLLLNEHLDIYFPSAKQLEELGIQLKVGDAFMNVDFFNMLIQMGYKMSQDIMLAPGEYRRSGGIVDVFSINSEHPHKFEIEYDKISHIWEYHQDKKKVGKELKETFIYPLARGEGRETFLQTIPKESILVIDELDEFETEEINVDVPHVKITSFPEDEKDYIHLRYLSVLKFYTLSDLLNDIREKMKDEWTTVLLTKRFDEICNIFAEENIPYTKSLSKKEGIKVIDGHEFSLPELPPSFQNPQLKFQLITDKEIFSLRKRVQNKSLKRINLEFLSSLKEGDYVVHLDHGIGQFLGIVQREIDNIIREYLEIAYAENDKLFVPVDQADKVSKYISREDIEDTEIKLSRLGSKEWKNITKKVKKETEKIAKELLKIYAEREQAKGFKYMDDNDEQRKFEQAFPYEETPGQIKAIQDIKIDMESTKTMDRLVCGDVGFGKTEVAMRAAFKAVQSGKQVAFISPITILADQHYKTFVKRAKGFNLKIEMLSRFRTPKEQRDIIEKLQKGKIDIIVGTHRILQPDVKFFNLGIVIVDEEQRFGVKQKEAFKKLRASVDILTLTATPIPRTLNLSLNKLRDITIITTPPPGRLPVITEVRKFGNHLIREVILKEIDRKGQIYFLHNRVETIDSMTEKLQILVPEARFVTAHGQLGSGDLESRIIDFKEHKYDVLVSSTIIENGIDLANANTLIVNNAENLGLSQLYQLRGRIGRGKTQAYAYFLYNKQKLKDDAKKRLRAVVEASELGAGFQIAMRDLEIRGAGEILGVGQSGNMNTVGASHFIRLLNQTIEEMKSGKKEEKLDAHEDVTIELPVEAYIPDTYIPDRKEKLSIYQKISAVDSDKLLQEFRNELEDEYGQFPIQVETLFKLLVLKLMARRAGVLGIKSEIIQQGGKQIVLSLSDKITAEHIIKVLQHNEKWLISGTKLKINIKDLGFNWVESLKETLNVLIKAGK